MDKKRAIEDIQFIRSILNKTDTKMDLFYSLVKKIGITNLAAYTFVLALVFFDLKWVYNGYFVLGINLSQLVFTVMFSVSYIKKVQFQSFLSNAKIAMFVMLLNSYPLVLLLGRVTSFNSKMTNSFPQFSLMRIEEILQLALFMILTTFLFSSKTVVSIVVCILTLTGYVLLIATNSSILVNGSANAYYELSRILCMFSNSIGYLLVSVIGKGQEKRWRSMS